MSNESSNSGFAFIAGLVVGGAVGALAGLLFAPQTGEETRRQLGEKTKEVADDLYDKFDDFKESMTDVVEEVKRGTAETLESVKKSTAEMLDEVKSGKDGAKTAKS